MWSTVYTFLNSKNSITILRCQIFCGDGFTCSANGNVSKVCISRICYKSGFNSAATSMSSGISLCFPIFTVPNDSTLRSRSRMA